MESPLVVGRRLVQVLLAQPVISVVLVGPHDRVREAALVARHQATDMVAVHVGDADLIDLFGRVTGGFQVGGQPAEGRAEQAGGAGVD